jgi:hypothetical protein
MELNTTYYLDGKIESEVLVINGKKEGIYKKYDENGNIIITCNYIDDKIQGIMNTYNVNFYGIKLNEIINYIDSKKEGKYIQLYNDYNNQIYNIFNYIDDKKMVQVLLIMKMVKLL